MGIKSRKNTQKIPGVKVGAVGAEILGVINGTPCIWHTLSGRNTVITFFTP